MQGPIEVLGPDNIWNEPEPDLAVFALTEGDEWPRHPRADELLLVVEVSDSSLRQDSVAKGSLYARSSVPCSPRAIPLRVRPSNASITETQ